MSARVAGRYTLHVWSGYKRDAVAGSPFDVTVLPGQAAASACVAHLEAGASTRSLFSST